MPQNNLLNNSSEGVELYAVACIHCGETVFKFSRNMLEAYDVGVSTIKLKCPKCNKVTVYFSDGAIETG